MNESAVRTEEQIISLFPDRETQVCRSNTGGWAFAEPVFTTVIRKNRRKNLSEKRNRKWIYRMKNVSW